MPQCDLSFDCVLQIIRYQLFMNFVRYYPIAGLAFFVLYIWKKKSLWPYKIQDKLPKWEHISREIKQSAVTLVVFSFIGLSVFILSKLGYLPVKVYRDADKFGGVPWMIASFVLLTIWHETWFYWAHRLMHHKKIYPHVHLMHHKSVNPTPIAAYNFHWTEAFVEALYLPIFICVVPLYFKVMIFHTFYAMILNIIWHFGFEFFPKGFASHPVWKWISTSTHHNMHHQKFNGNYGLYFNFWDRVMGTNFPNYESYYDTVVEKRNHPVSQEIPSFAIEPIDFFG
jgi:sterol desaturase/sphingolipid hydroxylase (fatty acid hydroxylase superfamily)